MFANCTCHSGNTHWNGPSAMLPVNDTCRTNIRVEVKNVISWRGKKTETETLAGYGGPTSWVSNIARG